MNIIKAIMSIPLKLSLYIIGSIIYVLATALKLLNYTTTIIKGLIILTCVLLLIVIFTLFISDDLEGISVLMIVAFYIFSAIVYSLIDFVNIMSKKLNETSNKIFKSASLKKSKKKNYNIDKIINENNITSNMKPMKLVNTNIGSGYNQFQSVNYIANIPNSQSHGILLHVPFTEKDEVKRLGAWWNPEHKKWFVKYRNNYLKFKKWISKESSFYVIYDYLYIIEGTRVCYNCHQRTRVIGFGIEKYIEFSDEHENGYRYNIDDEIHIASSLEPIPDKLLKFIQQNYNYENTYSNFAKGTYLANRCDHCNTLQGNNYVFHECDSPFFLDEEEKALNLKLYKVSLNYDIAFNDIDMSFSSGDMLIKELSKIQDSGLIL